MANGSSAYPGGNPDHAAYQNMLGSCRHVLDCRPDDDVWVYRMNANDCGSNDENESSTSRLANETAQEIPNDDAGVCLSLTTEGISSRS